MQVNWTGFTCPSGTGSVSAYKVTLTNGTFAADGSADPVVRPDRIARPMSSWTTRPGSLIVTYTVTCTGNGASRESDASPQAQATITPAADDGGDEGTDG